MIFDAFCLVVGTRRTILEVAGNLMKGDWLLAEPPQTIDRSIHPTIHPSIASIHPSKVQSSQEHEVMPAERHECSFPVLMRPIQISASNSGNWSYAQNNASLAFSAQLVVKQPKLGLVELHNPVWAMDESNANLSKNHGEEEAAWNGSGKCCKALWRYLPGTLTWAGAATSSASAARASLSALVLCTWQTSKAPTISWPPTDCFSPKSGREGFVREKRCH